MDRQSKSALLYSFSKDIYSSLNDRPKVFEFADEESVLTMYPRLVVAYKTIMGLDFESIYLINVVSKLREALVEHFDYEIMFDTFEQDYYRYKDITPAQAMFDVMKELTIRIRYKDLDVDDNKTLDQIEIGFYEALGEPKLEIFVNPDDDIDEVEEYITDLINKMYQSKDELFLQKLIQINFEKTNRSKIFKIDLMSDEEELEEDINKIIRVIKKYK